jgi:hypothetical protein
MDEQRLHQHNYYPLFCFVKNLIQILYHLAFFELFLVSQVFAHSIGVMTHVRMERGAS